MKTLDTLPERIMGTETEYNPVFVGTNGTERLWDSNLSLRLPDGVRELHSFATNGARFYVWGHIPEYATPETLGAADIVHGEEAGETYMRHAALRHVEARSDIASVTLHKRTATDEYYESSATKPTHTMNNMRSWGYHENYLSARKFFEDDLTRDIVAAQLATRGILVGAGYWRPTFLDPGRILPSQKLLDINAHRSQDTIKTKPLLNLRDEAHADIEWARWHITCGDVNIYPWSTWMKAGSTSLDMRLGETRYGQRIKDRLLENPFAAAHVIARQGILAKVRLRNGNEAYAIDVQEMLTETDEALSEEVGLPAGEKLILSERRRAIDDFRCDPTLLQDRAEWVARDVWIQKVLRRLGPNHPKLLWSLGVADKMWDRMLPSSADKSKQGIAFRQRDQAPFPGYNPDRSVELVHIPPERTRASERTELIKSLVDTCFQGYLNWEGTSNSPLPNPYGNQR